MPILQVKNFKKAFGGVKAVNDMDFSAEAGKITGLIGPNGSGKSTMINLITGIIPKDKGVVILSDKVKIEDIKSHDMHAYKITRTFQNVKLFEQMSVLDNLLVVLTRRNIWSALFETKSELHEDRAKDILKSVGLYDKRNELAGGLSYGQRKLLEIGRVIAMDADVILFDEPYAGLFPEMVKKVSGMIKEMRKENKAVILVEHNMELIRELCDHVVVMDAGKLLAEGTPEKVLNQRDVVEAYLGE
ncbi:ABC transporter ATP-binding protein [Candidatus Pacebacteria bacterium]|nr:ABC transporter ATP-binding protein [Candidatus Paceibacterota bacterium]